MITSSIVMTPHATRLPAVGSRRDCASGRGACQQGYRARLCRVAVWMPSTPPAWQRYKVLTQRRLRPAMHRRSCGGAGAGDFRPAPLAGRADGSPGRCPFPSCAPCGPLEEGLTAPRALVGCGRLQRSSRWVMMASTCSRVILATSRGMPCWARKRASWWADSMYVCWARGDRFSARRWRP